MKREILFKGKPVENSEWVTGFLAMSLDKTKAVIFDETFDFDVIPETIGQFTGVLDKNGVKIFEGDKIKTPVGISVVEFSHGVFGLNHDFGTEKKTMLGSWGQEHNLRTMDDGYNGEIEVIGNIHDKD